MRATVDHHHLAVDVAGTVGDQEAGEVGKLAVLAGASHRVARGPPFVATRGAELARGAGGREWSRRDRDGADGPSGPIPRRDFWSSPARPTSPSPTGR